MLLKKRTSSFFQASHFIIHSKNFVTISPRHVCSLQYICQQHNILTMKQQHDIKCKENLDKIRVADGIWTHDPLWSSLLITEGRGFKSHLRLRFFPSSPYI